jgi:hypothetical protein
VVRIARIRHEAVGFGAVPNLNFGSRARAQDLIFPSDPASGEQALPSIPCKLQRV